MRSWQTAYRGLVPDAFLDAMSVPERMLVWRALLGRTDARHTSVAERGGWLVGFISLGPARDPDGDKGIGEVYALHAAPERRLTGIGTALLAQGELELRLLGTTAARLWVLEANAPAIGFYERRGWRFDGVTKAEPLGPGQPAPRQVRMAKALAPVTLAP